MAGWRIPDRAGAGAGSGGRGTRQLQGSNGTSTGHKAVAAGNVGFTYHSDTFNFNMNSVGYAACIAAAGAAFMATMFLLYRMFRFITLELALRRRNIPFALYPPKGAAYPANDVHTVCVMCISKYSRFDRIAVLGCGHIFHRGCLRKEVARENPVCPLCRAAM